MLAGSGPLERAPARGDAELRRDLSHRLCDLVLLQPEQVILSLQVLDVLVQPVYFLLCCGARVMVTREELGQEREDLARLLDPLRDSLSGFSSGCGIHGHCVCSGRGPSPHVLGWKADGKPSSPWRSLHS